MDVNTLEREFPSEWVRAPPVVQKVIRALGVNCEVLQRGLASCIDMMDYCNSQPVLFSELHQEQLVTKQNEAKRIVVTAERIVIVSLLPLSLHSVGRLMTTLSLQCWVYLFRQTTCFIFYLLQVKGKLRANLYKEHMVWKAEWITFETRSHLIRQLSINKLVLPSYWPEKNNNNFAGKASGNVPS